MIMAPWPQRLRTPLRAGCCLIPLYHFILQKEDCILVKERVTVTADGQQVSRAHALLSPVRLPYQLMRCFPVRLPYQLGPQFNVIVLAQVLFLRPKRPSSLYVLFGFMCTADLHAGSVPGPRKRWRIPGENVMAHNCECMKGILPLCVSLCFDKLLLAYPLPDSSCCLRQMEMRAAPPAALRLSSLGLLHHSFYIADSWLAWHTTTFTAYHMPISLLHSYL